MIKFVLFVSPMSFLYIFGLTLSNIMFKMRIFLLSLLFSFLFGQSNMTPLAKEWLEVITWYNFLIIFDERIDVLRTNLVIFSFYFVGLLIFAFLGEVGFWVGQVMLCIFLVVGLCGEMKLVHVVFVLIEKYKS
jgi:hypothetical protein